MSRSTVLDVVGLLKYCNYKGYNNVFCYVCRYLFTIVSYLIGVFVFATIVGMCCVLIAATVVNPIKRSNTVTVLVICTADIGDVFFKKIGSPQMPA